MSGRKGTLLEKKAADILTNLGYRVHRVSHTGTKRGNFWVSQSNDVFSCDLVAKRLGERTRWIQCTADSGIGRKKAALDEIPWNTAFDNVEIWRWVGGRKGRKHKVTGKPLDAQYWQIYRRDERYELNETNRIRDG